MTYQQMIQTAHSAGFSAAALIDTKDIIFNPEFRPYCAENYCGHYNANYSCPPICGSPGEMKQRVLQYKKALVLQSTWNISDYTNETAVRAAKKGHNAMTLDVINALKKSGYAGLSIGASSCSLCNPCKMQTGEPCSFPELAWSCMSAYCIYVKALATHCDMTYICEPGHLNFFGLYLFNDQGVKSS